jgi:hypothetical protein
MPTALYPDAVRNAILKPEGHVKKRLPEEYRNDKRSLRLYSVTTLDSRHTRTVAICRFPRAKEMIQHNETDLCEGGTNKLCVIEAVIVDHPMGGLLDEAYWYVWQDERYVAIHPPKEFQGITSWGIG